MGFRDGEQAAGRVGPGEELTPAREDQWTHAPCPEGHCGPAGPAQAFFADVTSAEASPDPAGPAPVFKHHELTGDLFYRTLNRYFLNRTLRP